MARRSDPHEERWRPIPGYDGMYEISTEGRIRSWMPMGGYPAKAPRQITLRWDNRRMTQTVLLGPMGKRKNNRVVSLMRDVWMDGKRPGFVVSHRNGVKADNRLENLEYIRYAERNYKSRTCSRPVIKILPDGGTQVFPSVRAAARDAYIVPDGMGKRIKYGTKVDGCIWRYDD